MGIIKAIMWGIVIGFAVVVCGILFLAFPLIALLLFIIVLLILAIRKKGEKYESRYGTDK